MKDLLSIHTTLESFRQSCKLTWGKKNTWWTDRWWVGSVFIGFSSSSKWIYWSWRKTSEEGETFSFQVGRCIFWKKIVKADSDWSSRTQKSLHYDFFWQTNLTWCLLFFRSQILTGTSNCAFESLCFCYTCTNSFSWLPLCPYSWAKSSWICPCWNCLFPPWFSFYSRFSSTLQNSLFHYRMFWF